MRVNLQYKLNLTHHTKIGNREKEDYNFLGLSTSKKIEHLKEQKINSEEGNAMGKRNTRSPKKAVNRRFNPVKAKLESISECFDQLRHGLPAKQEEYVEGDRITHSYVKSCFLMIIQRAVDINNVIIEFSGQTPPQQKHQSFRALHQNSAIDRETLDFFMNALDYYEKIANPYQELAPAELYDASLELLKYGEAYTSQLENFFVNFSPS